VAGLTGRVVPAVTVEGGNGVMDTGEEEDGVGVGRDGARRGWWCVRVLGAPKYLRSRGLGLTVGRRRERHGAREDHHDEANRDGGATCRLSIVVLQCCSHGQQIASRITRCGSSRTTCNLAIWPKQSVDELREQHERDALERLPGKIPETVGLYRLAKVSQVLEQV
jgi:hypothetical protein